MRKYISGFTLIEVLTVIFIFALSSILLAMNWQSFNSHLYFQVERQRLAQYLFLVQKRAYLSAETWELRVSVSADQQRWCLIAQRKAKSETMCDCLRLRQCNVSSSLVYTPYQEGMHRFIAKNYYPKTLTSFNGIRDTTKKACFVLQNVMNKQRIVFKYSGFGGVRLNGEDSNSVCLQENE